MVLPNSDTSESARLKEPRDLADKPRMRSKSQDQVKPGQSRLSGARRVAEYSVYVVELDESKRRGATKSALYVGQTALSPEDRLAQHLNHQHSSRHVRGHAVRLRPDLYAEHNPLPTRAEAESKEAWLAAKLRSEGYDVYSN